MAGKMGGLVNGVKQDLHDNPKGKDRRNWAGIWAAVFYGSMSVASVFLNKAIFEVWRYRYPASLVSGQTVFTVLAIFTLSRFGVIKLGKFNVDHFKRVFTVSAVFQLKLVLDMSALVLVNIPMYGILKSSTTPFVMLLDYILRGRVPATRIQMAVWVTTVGGLVAGFGDLHFEPLGYVLALSSAACTACYVVLVGKLGDELQLDDVSTVQEMFTWTSDALLGEVNRLREFGFETGESFAQDRAMIRMYNQLLGSVRLSQRRVIEGECAGSDKLQNQLGRCYAALKKETEESRPYGPWHDATRYASAAAASLVSPSAYETARSGVLAAGGGRAGFRGGGPLA